MAGKKQNNYEPLIKLLQQGSSLTKQEMMTRLDRDARTIQRYLKEIREQGFQIIETGKPVRYALGAFEWELINSSLRITEAEFGILKTAIEAAHVFFGETAYNQDLQRIMRKLGEGIDESLLEIDLDQYAEHWYFHAVSASYLQSNTLKRLAEAIWKRQGIVADYFSRKSQIQNESILLYPHCLAWINGSWLLAATYTEGGKMRDFSVADFANIRIADPQNDMDHFTRNADFVPQQFYRYRFSGMASNNPNETHEVRIQVLPDKARAFKRKQYHPTQQLEAEKPDGALIVSFECESLFDIKSWVLGWGGGVRVLEPPELVSMIQQDIEAMRKLYA